MVLSTLGVMVSLMCLPQGDTSVSYRLSARQLLHKSILSVIAIYAIVAV